MDECMYGCVCVCVCLVHLCKKPFVLKEFSLVGISRVLITGAFPDFSEVAPLEGERISHGKYKKEILCLRYTSLALPDPTETLPDAGRVCPWTHPHLRTHTHLVHQGNAVERDGEPIAGRR